MALYTTDIMSMNGGADIAASSTLISIPVTASLSGGADITSIGRTTSRVISTVSGGADLTSKVKNITRLTTSNLSLSGTASLTAGTHNKVGLGKQTFSGGADLVEYKTVNIRRIDGVSYSGNGTVTLKANLWRWHTAKVNTMKVESKMEMFIYDQRDIGFNMQQYIPRYYKDSTHAQAIFNTEVSESVRLHASAIDVLNQFYIQTATWGLDRWEELFDIETDYSISFDDRRSSLLERIEGYYLITPQILTGITWKHPMYGSEIIQDFPNYKVTIKITEIRAIQESLDPKKFQKFINKIRALIPAHLQLEIDFTWAPWGEFLDADIRWGDVSSNNWNELKTQYYSKPLYIMEENPTWDEVQADQQMFGMTWDQFDQTDSNKLNDLEDFTWLQLDLETWNQFDSQITNKWEVAI